MTEDARCHVKSISY